MAAAAATITPDHHQQQHIGGGNLTVDQIDEIMGCAVAEGLQYVGRVWMVVVVVVD